MPEIPDLEVVVEVLQRRVVGQRVVAAQVPRPLVVRSLTPVALEQDLPGRRFQRFERRGKFLLAELEPERLLVINPMLTGALHLCDPQERVARRTFLILELENGRHLRYVDDRQMGMVYYLEPSQLPQIPRLGELGPDALAGISFEGFQEGLRRFHGEIKGILLRGSFLSGIGNAYADEILFAAGISPFRRRRTLSEEEQRRLHEAVPAVLKEAIQVVREEMGEEIHRKVRDFLKVHRKGGQSCPRCGGHISEITANQRITSYCRSCQPGMLIRN